MRLSIVLTFIIFFTAIAQSESPTVFNESDLNGEPQFMVRRYLEGIAKDAFGARAARYEALKTPEDIASYQQTGREFFVNALGGWPERTPLNAQIVGGGTGDGFRYEKIIYESLPKYYVTATLFLPETDGPYPGVLVPCGHSDNGKASEVYQRACILLARNGIAALIYDPIGQGERYHFFKDDKTPLFGTTLQHTTMGVPCILTGTNIARFRIWDGMRGLDYLESRPDILADRLGCTGNSGGGTLTSYIMALDDRVKVSAPSCYLTGFEKLFETIGPQDAEQDIYGQIAFGLDHADYVHLRAPKPTLMCAATRDFFDIDGTWGVFRESKRLYTRLGYPERMSIAEVDETHGFSKGLREAMVQWMCRWLLDKDVHIEEPDFAVVPESDLICSPEGQVIWMDGARSIFEIVQDRASMLADERADAAGEITRDEIRELIGARTDEERGAPKAESRGDHKHDEITFEHVVLTPEAGIELPALIALPQGAPQEVALIAHTDGKEGALRDVAQIHALLNAGKVVMLVDLRDMGETETIGNPKSWDEFVGKAWHDYFRAYLLGKSFVGMRTDDILECAYYLNGRFFELPLTLIATGECTVPAQHAVALQPERFARLILRGGIPSWQAVVDTPRARQQLLNTVHGVLAHYDLPDLAGLATGVEIENDAATVAEF